MGLLRRRVLACGMLAMPARAWTQPTPRAHRVGILSIGTDPANFGRWQHFVDSLQELGYVEGRNLVLLRGFSAGNFDLLPRLVTDLIDAQADVIVATGTREIRALKRATATIPIVMTLAADPVKEGFIASLARPGGNVTGMTSLIPGLAQKYVELLRTVVPSAKKFAVVATAPNPIPEIRRELQDGAAKLGLTLVVLQASDPTDYDRVMSAARAEGAAGIIHPLDGGTTSHRPAFVQAALKHGLPGIYWDVAHVEAGGLMSYSINFEAQIRRAAVIVDRILRGTKPADLPVEQPARIELVVNLRTAKALGITLPQSVLLRADRVIE